MRSIWPGRCLKSDYRRFNIRTATGGDDYGAMREALERRYTRLIREEARLPDVLLIDGGKGQLAEAQAVMESLQIDGITLVEKITKTAQAGLENLFLPDMPHPLELAPDSLALHLIQAVRAESASVAIAGHRTRRGKARRASTLEEILVSGISDGKGC